MASSPASVIGRRLGHYRVLEQIGAGGMGVVYRARDERLERDVALKVLPPGALADDSARKRFRKEALALSRLNHPNIATVFDFDSQEGTDFLVIELIPGTTLADKLLAGPLPEKDVLRIGVQVAEGLEAAHREGVVHRDLKPANLRLTPEGRVKILDFGLAKVLRGEPSATDVTASLTETQAVAGTVPYMAPEQLRGQPADPRTDVWALGIVLYEMAARARPFKGQTGFDLSSAILNQTPAPLPSQVPAALQAVIARCLEKEPARRYQRASEVRAVLEAIQSGAAPGAWRFRLARRRWLAMAAAVVVLAVVVGMSVPGLRQRLQGGGATPKLDSLAVLPFENLSGDPEQGYLAAGIHEALITDLAKLSGLQRVTARASVMRYQKTDKPLPQIAHELDVPALITGSVLRSGNRVRVTAHLIRIREGTEEHLWSDSYERELHDVLSLQNEIVATITRNASLRLTPQELAQLGTARTVNPEAYEAYLKGKFHINKFTSEGSEKGIAYLQQAIEKDPSNPLPYAALVLGYRLTGHGGVPEAYGKARAAAAKARELGGSLAETEEALAEVKLYWDWDWAGAEQGLQRALALNPSLPEAHAHYSWYLQLLGRRDEAYAEMQRAIAVDPLNPLWNAWLGRQYLIAGRNDEALAAVRKSLDLDPDFAWGLYVLGSVYAQTGRFDEAIAAHRKAVVASRVMRFALGRTYALAGRRAEALKIAAELRLHPTPMNRWGLASIYTALGKRDEAFRWLEAAFESRFAWMPLIRESIDFIPLHDDPRFHDLVRRMNLPKR